MQAKMAFYHLLFSINRKDLARKKNRNVMIWYTETKRSTKEKANTMWNEISKKM